MAYDRRRHSRYARRLATECKARAGWKCEECGSRYRIEAHHVEPLAKKVYQVHIGVTVDNLVCLCYDCHQRRHRRKRSINPWFDLLHLRQYGVVD